MNNIEETGVYTIWCEWDIGHEGTVYASEEAAKRAAEHLYKLQNFKNPFDEMWGDYIGVLHLDFKL